MSVVAQTKILTAFLTLELRQILTDVMNVLLPATITLVEFLCRLYNI